MPRKIAAADFVISAVAARDLPTDGRPEIALVGRSNVGKSSLINALVRKDVARTSAAPGKTRQVNVYRVAAPGSGAFYLIDLPGYGHASGGDKARQEFSALTATYFERRAGADAAGPRGPSPLRAVVLAVDARHPGLGSDVDALRWLHGLGLPYLVVATKADKLSQAERAKLRRTCLEAFGAEPLPTSSVKGDGLDELWQRLHEWTM